MPREYDSFIIIPSLTSSPIKNYYDYFKSTPEQNLEMVYLYFNNVASVYIHDSTPLEEKTIEFLEDPKNNIKIAIAQELKRLDPNSYYVNSVNILPEQTSNYHLVALTLLGNIPKKVITLNLDKI